jgi:hypothetical protein
LSPSINRSVDDTEDGATYWLAGYLKLLTAAASVAAAVVLPLLVPKVL